MSTDTGTEIFLVPSKPLRALSAAGASPPDGVAAVAEVSDLLRIPPNDGK
ncbi:hypothetical protein GCM10009841_31250 [Microlunatus panaciterrae]|uniref:Uncharacterized protein n=1 Tax=Microlunatus panaciterrae TaxID=400768 RepID=A0ABS2RFK5_9ACTN|nr:hypothetical protein [Microlunatus panaciterrae]MBM7797785.1 hypothetical protein [Microlunatus panaciterrae]